MGAGKSVLIVEDEGIVALEMQHALVDLGYSVPVIVSSSEQALKAVSNRCPDLVLMDIRIRGQPDGIETAAILKRNFDIPVVFLTAHTDSATVARAKATEPYGYLGKPVKPADLRSSVEVALHKHAIDKQLRERERWFSATLRSIGDAVISTDADGLVTYLNPAAELLTGFTATDARGASISDVLRWVDASDTAERSHPLLRALRTGQVLNASGTIYSRGGDEHEVADSAAPILGDTGQLLGAVIVFRDVSEQRRMREQLELADRLSSVGTMAAGVAHEINNPLTYVIGNIQLALERLGRKSSADRDPGLEQLLEGAERGARQVGRIVADLNRFARTSHDDGEPVAVLPVLEWSLAVAGRALGPHTNVVRDFGALPLVRASETKLGQVFVNLLVNAGQAVENEMPERQGVTVRTQTDRHGRAVVEIVDSGPGMTDETKRRAFDPFFSTKGPKGTGLGLSVCRGIVHSLDGTLEVESQPGAGSLFRVTLPAASEPKRPVAEDQPTREGTARACRPRARILVVDDEPMIGALAQGALTDHDVTRCTRAADGLALINNGSAFELILCDLNMPEMCGADFYEALLVSAPELAKRVVIMTGGATTLRAEEFLRSTHLRRLDKPFSLRALRRLVEDLAGTPTQSSSTR